MEILFVGVGGTRRVMARQYSRVYTGGFRIDFGEGWAHVDPGPGAVLRSAELGAKVENTDLLVVTHNHLDHASDANAIAEAMNGFGFKKRGTLVCPRSVLDREKCEGLIHPYFSRMFKQVSTPNAGEQLELEVGLEKVLLRTTKVKHSDQNGWGFVMEHDGKKLGYTSDTEWFEGLGRQFERADVLIANITHIRGGKVHLSMEEHLDSLLEESKVGKLLVYHIGEDFVHFPKDELEEIFRSYENRHGSRIILPLSGDRIRV